jgi:hypothetical protein
MIENEQDCREHGKTSMPIHRRSTLVAFALLTVLSSCGPPLGAYRIERVDVVAAGRLHDIDPEWDPESSSPLLRIVFTSDRDVETASGGTGSGLYLWADFCPFRDKVGLQAAGPYYGDRPIFTQVAPRRLPSGVYEVPYVPNRHPPRDPRTGRFIYTGYISLSQAPEPLRHDETYDLARDDRDICLRLDHPGYYLTPSRSDIFRLPAAAVTAAIARGIVSPPLFGSR